MKKRIFVAAIAAMMVATLVGCGKEDNKNVEVQTETAVEDAVTEEVAEIPAEGAETVEVVEEESNTVDMTIEEYFDYMMNPDSPTKNGNYVEEFIFGIQTQSDSENVCSNFYEIQHRRTDDYNLENLSVVDMRNCNRPTEMCTSDVNGKTVYPLNGEWFTSPTFAYACDGLLDKDAVWNGIVFEYDASIDSTVMKAINGNVIAYFGEAEVISINNKSFIAFTTHFDDGDYVVYICTEDYYGKKYPTKDADGKEINFVTHH